MRRRTSEYLNQNEAQILIKLLAVQSAFKPAIRVST